MTFLDMGPYHNNMPLSYSPKTCSKYAHDDYLYKKERFRRGFGGYGNGGGVFRRMMRSVATVAKITLVCLNIWVLAVVLVVSLGHWRVFDTESPSTSYDNSHLVVMRELKVEEDRKLPIMAMSVSNMSDVESYYVPPGEDSLYFKTSQNDNNVKKEIAPPVANPEPPGPAPPNHAKTAAEDLPSASDTSASARLKNMMHWCKQQHINKTPYDKIPAQMLSNIFVDEKHKLAFCQVPGVAQNEWRKILLILGKFANTTAPSAIAGGDVYGKFGKSLKKLSDIKDGAHRSEVLSKFTKVMFVRDPLERLLMTYYTKLKPAYSKYFHKTFGSNIIKKYRPGATDEEIKSGSSVKFTEFVHYIVDAEFEGKAPLNEHWQQYYRLCHPCAIDFTFVGGFESAESDTRTVLAKLGAEKEVKPPYIESKKTLSEKELLAAYRHVDISLLQKIYKVYSADYTLFGYKCPDFLHNMMEKAKVFHDY